MAAAKGKWNLLGALACDLASKVPDYLEKSGSVAVASTLATAPFLGPFAEVVGALVGIGKTYFVDRWRKNAEAKERFKALLTNEDIAKAQARAIQGRLVKFAGELTGYGEQQHGAKVLALANSAEVWWPDLLAERVNGDLAALGDKEVTKRIDAYMDGRVRKEELEEAWSAVFYEANTDRTGDGPLPETILRRAARKVIDHFDGDIVEVLKDDAAHGGKAYAAVSLRYMSSISQDIDELKGNAQKVSDALDQVRTALLQLEDLPKQLRYVVEKSEVRIIEAVQGAEGRLAAQSKEGFAANQQALDNIQSLLTDRKVAPKSWFGQLSGRFAESDVYRKASAALNSKKNGPFTLVLHGPHGTGKSQIAAQLQRDYADKGVFTCIVRTARDESRTKDLEKIAQSTGIDVTKLGQSVSTALHALSCVLPDGERWLVVLDDVTEEQRADVGDLSLDNLDVVVTTNIASWPGTVSLNVDVLRHDEVYDFAQAITRVELSSAESQALKDLHELFGGLQIALSIALKTAAMEKLSLRDFHDEIKADSRRFLKGASDNETGRELATLYDRAFMIAESKGAAATMAKLALCYGADVPIQLLGDEGTSRDAVRSQLRILVDLSLVVYNTGGWSVKVHKLVQNALQERWSDHVRLASAQLVRRASELFVYDWNLPRTYSEALTYWPHVRSLLEYVKGHVSDIEDFKTPLMKLVEMASTYEYFDARFKEKLLYIEWWQELGAEDVDEPSRRRAFYHARASAHMHLEEMEPGCGHYEKAVSDAERAVKESESTSAIDPLEYSGYLGCLGCVHRLCNRVDVALETFERAICHLAQIDDCASLNMDTISSAIAGLARREDWDPWRAFGNLCTNRAVLLHGLGRLSEAGVLIRLACECHDSASNTEDHIWKGMTHYYAFCIGTDLQWPVKELIQHAHVAQHVLGGQVPTMSCIGSTVKCFAEVNSYLASAVNR